jgi:hypothetical protein
MRRNVAALTRDRAFTISDPDSHPPRIRKYLRRRDVDPFALGDSV